MRRGFTLIELLVVIGIMGLMVTVGLVSVSSGRGAARVKGATRDVFAAIRHARSTALVTGQPAIVTYSTEESDGEVMAKIEITSARLFDSSFDRSKAQTLTGGPLEDAKNGHANLASVQTNAPSGEASEQVETKDGETLEDVLFAPIDTSIVKGIRIKVVTADEAEETTVRRTNKISVFSNVDYLLGKFKSAKAQQEKKDANETATGQSASGSAATTGIAEEKQEPVSVVWETNGRVEAHQVWVYADGKRPEDGLSIKIDRFGAAKVISGDGREDD